MKPDIFYFGQWQVAPGENSLCQADQTRQIEPRAMDVLVALCQQPGTVLSAEQLLLQCWGNTLYGDNPVHKVITQLRKALGDQSSAPTYIETIRKRGYRTLAAVQYPERDAAPAGQWIGQSPFRGLLPFEQEHAAIFFGRNDAIFKLGKLLARLTSEPDQPELVLILGPSGAGKTSLVRAGLLPHLMQTNNKPMLLSHASIDLAQKGLDSLLWTLCLMLLRLNREGHGLYGHGLFGEHNAASLQQAMLQNMEQVLTPLRHSLADLPHARHALFIDRFEAIFDQESVSTSEREQFLTCLDQLARSHAVLILLACRNDFYPQIAACPNIMAGKAHGAHFDLAPPSQAEIAQIIRRPAMLAELTFGVRSPSGIRLDDVLCESAMDNPDALPLLQYTLQELYRMRSDEGELSFDAFDQLGGIGGAIGQRAEQVINQLAPPQKQSLPRVLSLVTTFSSQDSLVTGRRAARDRLANDNELAVVNALVQSRLFVSELVNGAPGFGVAHEALLRRWPRAAEWIATHRHALQIRGRVGDLAARWQTEGQSQDLLLPEGKQLDEAQSLLTLPAFSLSAEEQALILASAARARTRRHLRRFALGSFALLCLLTSALGISAVSAKRQALAQRAEAEGLVSYMLGDFVESLRPLGKLDLLDSVGQKALAYFGASDNDELSQSALTQRAEALNVLAEVHVARANPKAARIVLDKANTLLLKQLRERARDVDVIKRLADNRSWLGYIHLDNNEWPQAAALFGKKLAYSNLLNQIEPNNPNWWAYQAGAHSSLAILAFNQRKFTLANREFLQALELINRARAALPQDAALKSQFATLISWLGSLKNQSGELTAAMRLYQQESAMYRQLLQAAPLDAVLAGQLANSLGKQGNLALAFGKKTEALALFLEMDSLLKRNLAIEPNNGYWLRNLTAAQLGIQNSQPQQENRPAILANLKQISQTTAKLIQFSPDNPDWINRDTAVRVQIATQLLRLGRLNEAEQELTAVLKKQHASFLANPSNLASKIYLNEVWLAQAELENQRGNPALAQKICWQGYNLLTPAMTDSRDFQILRHWLRLNLCLGNQFVAKKTQKELNEMGIPDSPP